jgi:hypothetical protein
MRLAANKLLATPALNGHNKETAVAKAKKPVTAKRKVFLDAIEKLGKYFDESGLVVEDKFDADQLAVAIMELFDKLPKRLRNVDDMAVLFGSALYVLQMPADLRQADTCSETCRGALPFEAAFFAGWGIGFDQGQEDAADEMKEEAT